MRILKKILLSFTTFFFTLLVAELTLTYLSTVNYKIRLLTYNPKTATGTQSIDSLQTLSKTTTCFLPPGSIVNGFATNSRGFLTPDVPFEKPANTYRVLLIGDSYAYGTIPYPLTFIRIVEKKLQEKLGNEKKIEVINLGIPCTGPGTYERVLALEGIKYDPDLILVSIFLGNDLTDDVMLNSKIKELNIKAPTPAWYERLKLYNFVKNLYIVENSFKKTKMTTTTSQKVGVYTGEGAEEYKPNTPILNNDDYTKMSKDKLYLFIKDYGVYDENFTNVQATLNEVNTLSKRYNKNILYLLFPDELQFKPEFVFSLATEEEKKKIDLNLPQNQMEKYFIENKIDYIDFYPFLNSQPDPSHFYQPNDSHLNSLGNEAVTGPIVNRILQKQKNDTTQ